MQSGPCRQTISCTVPSACGHGPRGGGHGRQLPSGRFPGLEVLGRALVHVQMPVRLPPHMLYPAGERIRALRDAERAIIAQADCAGQIEVLNATEPWVDYGTHRRV